MYLLPAAVASILPLTIFKGGKIHDKGERYAPPGDTLPLFFINYFFGEQVKEQGDSLLLFFMTYNLLRLKYLMNRHDRSKTRIAIPAVMPSLELSCLGWLPIPMPIPGKPPPPMPPPWKPSGG